VTAVTDFLFLAYLNFHCPNIIVFHNFSSLLLIAAISSFEDKHWTGIYCIQICIARFYAQLRQFSAILFPVED